MSAAFNFRKHLCWGTNGMIELYLERMAAAPTQNSADAALAQWLQNQREAFYMGAVVVLDDILTDRARAARFVALLAGATAEMLSETQLTEYGRAWVAREIPVLKAHIAEAAYPPDS